MKILFYNHTGQISGAERMLLLILAGLDHEQFTARVLSPANGPLLKEVEKLGIESEEIALLDARFTIRPDRMIRYLMSFAAVIRQLRNSISQTNPDLVHANSIRAGLVTTIATMGLGTRVVWHLHDLLPRHPLSSAIRVFAFMFARARMIAVSEAVADNFSGRLFSLRNRVSVILNGIDMKRFQEPIKQHRATRAELGFSETDQLVGIVGQLTQRKGQLELIEAFAETLKKTPNAVLLIVGSPLFNRDYEYEETLKATAVKLGIAERVRFLGEREDVPALMQALDLLVVNSIIEPFGLVVIEAMASGTPVLAAMSGGIPELIEHGRTGWLFPQGDKQALATGISKLLESPSLRLRLVVNANGQLTRYKAPNYLAQLYSFYRSNFATLPFLEV